MKPISYFRIFGFLAFTGSAFLSTIFHYPIFSTIWFVSMIIFIATANEENSGLAILAYSVLAYVPLGLIATLERYVSKNINNYSSDISPFAWMLFAFAVIEFFLNGHWIYDIDDQNIRNAKAQRKSSA